MEKEADHIKSSALKYSWYMRGGVSYTDYLNMSNMEREAIAKIVDDNLETTKNTKLPFFWYPYRFIFLLFLFSLEDELRSSRTSLSLSSYFYGYLFLTSFLTLSLEEYTCRFEAMVVLFSTTIGKRHAMPVILCHLYPRQSPSLWHCLLPVAL